MLNDFIFREHISLKQAQYNFHNPVSCNFIKREKRFFSYFDKNGHTLVAHCVNTGLMEGLLVNNSPSILSSKTTGTLSYTWEAVKINDSWMGVNTFTPNRLVSQILQEDFIREKLIRDLKYKPDFSKDNIIIEVKNVHLVKDGRAFFPDCISERASRQLNALMILKERGYRCIVIYILQNSNAEVLSVHPTVDKVYLETSLKAAKVGVEFLAFNCQVNESFICLNKQIKYL